jgi:alpha-L-fucosidase
MSSGAGTTRSLAACVPGAGAALSSARDMARRPTRRQFLEGSAGLAAWSLVAPRALGQESPVPEAAQRVARFENLAYGLFVHWGLYALHGEGADVMQRRGIPPADYMAAMAEFEASEFSGRELARSARRAGMGYATLTARHHDGFHLFDTRGRSAHDVTHTPAGRDLLADFLGGCRAENVLPLVYVSLLDWSGEWSADGRSAHLARLRDVVEVLATEYGPLGGFWFDGTWSPTDSDWELDELYALVRRHQPDALVLENSGAGRGGRVSHPEVDSLTYEREAARLPDRRGHPKYLAVETSLALNAHWGRAERDFAYLSPADVIEALCGARRVGSNLLLALAPGASGALPDYERATIERAGEWLALHGGLGGPIYRGRTCGLVGMQRDYGLRQGRDHYLFAYDLAPTTFGRPSVPARGPGERIWQGVAGEVRRVSWIDNGEELAFRQDGPRLTMQATGFPSGTNTVVRIARVES